MDAGLKRELEAKVYAGERLTREDGEALYSSDDLTWLGRLAHHKRTELNGDRVMFNVNRHLNLTNVCSASCAYCSFQRKPGEKDAYTMRIDEAVRKAKEMEDEQLTELHIVNGLHPTLPWRYYPKVLRELKAALPNVKLKAFTATEVQWFEKISGLVDVQSVLGQGTTIRIKIPLTLAIIPALVVSAQGRRYAVPQVNLLELLRLDAVGDGPKVETIQGTPVYRLRGQLLPLVSLREQLRLDASTADATYIAVLQADDRQFGLVVDDIQDTEEIVVKPLGSLLRHIDVYAGATIMGDGEVALILDTTALAQHAGGVSQGPSRASPSRW